MMGYQIPFFTQQDRKLYGKPLGECLIQLAKELGLRGATMMAATEGFGQSGRVHSAHFFDLADQPQEVIRVATDRQAKALFARIRAAGQEGMALFYVKTPVEFGVVGDVQQDS